MHELSIMTSILDIVLEEANQASAKKVLSISLQIGAKSGVVIDALEFAFDVATKNTIAEGAKLDIEVVPLKGECASCGHQFTSEDFLVCEKCGGLGKILSGQELKIQSIEVE